MAGIAKNIYWKILNVLPTKPALYLIYFRGYKKILNLRTPKYFGEKIQWLKLYGGLDELGSYVDKYEVRDYVRRIIGESYLNKVYGVYETTDDIDLEALPEKFVLKCTNGTQAIIICCDKKKIDWDKAKAIMNKWLVTDWSRTKKEFQYKNIKNRIIAEEYLEDDSHELRDYKFYCFNGEPLYYSIFSDRFSDETIDTYTIEGELLPDFRNGGKKTKTSVNPPNILDKLDEFIQLSRKLSRPFTFVRVDFYLVSGNIYFGELTFTDGAGSDPMEPIDKYDIDFGRRIPLKKIMK